MKVSHERKRRRSCTDVYVMFAARCPFTHCEETGRGLCRVTRGLRGRTRLGGQPIAEDYTITHIDGLHGKLHVAGQLDRPCNGDARERRFPDISRRVPRDRLDRERLEESIWRHLDFL